MLLNIITTILLGSSLYFSYKDFLQDSSLIKFAYFRKKWDYLWAFLLVTIVFTLVGIHTKMDLPRFLTWSWTSFLSDGKQTGNVIAVPFNSGSIILIILFWFIMCLAMPYLAKSEEEAFRSNITTIKSRILNSIGFGLIHMVVGVPLYIALVLCFVGFVFSIFYMRTYNKFIYISDEKANLEATLASTSIHSKYNFIILTIGALASVLLLTMS